MPFALQLLMSGIDLHTFRSDHGDLDIDIPPPSSPVGEETNFEEQYA